MILATHSPCLSSLPHLPHSPHFPSRLPCLPCLPQHPRQGRTSGLNGHETRQSKYRQASAKNEPRSRYKQETARKKSSIQHLALTVTVRIPPCDHTLWGKRCFPGREVSSPQSWRHRATALWTGSALSLLGLAALLSHGRARRPPRCSCGARMGRLRPAEMEELEEGQQAATWWQHNGESSGNS